MNRRPNLTALAAGMILTMGAQAAQARPPSAGELMSEAGHMGLSLQAWQQHRAGQRASAPDTGAHSSTSGHMGLSLQAWQEYRAGERGR